MLYWNIHGTNFERPSRGTDVLLQVAEVFLMSETGRDRDERLELSEEWRGGDVVTGGKRERRLLWSL